ncbi:DNA gyrase subunit A [Candidatus Peribacteria bacterium]|nr:DNA gyrase subunit A [Candidatus Peribacteria bacterium]
MTDTPLFDDSADQSYDRVRQKDIVTDMQEAYISYAMSVIVARALPDVRDGLKPVHRRVLYQMHDSGMRKSAKYKKSAKLVGDTLGNFHPHGDQSVYMTLVRMAQDFSLRYPLVDGQGNFGSIDGDSPAQMRYTEARMERITELMLQDIDKNTVPWRPNYDASKDEPTVLPTVIPQLLLNGSMGIAVGMATNIPPHNLGEVVDATLYMLEHEDSTMADLLPFIKGPDFPTAAEIYDGGDIAKALSTGRGAVTMRAKTHIEELKGGRTAIIIDEVPYQVNKAQLVEKIGDLVRDKTLEAITALRDESNREGIRVVMELKKGSFPKKVLNQLFKLTPMQRNFSYNMIALVDGIHPRLLNVHQILTEFIAHRYVVIVRRTEYDLRVAQARAHILEGLKIALDDIDAVIATIKQSQTKEAAAGALMEQFGLSELQVRAILEMRLQTLAGLERQKIEDELAEKHALITQLQGILADKKKQTEIIKTELSDAKQQYGDPRRTLVHPGRIGEFRPTDTIPNEPMLLSLTETGYIKRLSPDTFRTQKRGGVGVKSTSTKDDDRIIKTRQCMTHDELLFFTSEGRVFRLPCYEVPEASRTAKGTPIVNLLELSGDESVTEILNWTEALQQGESARFIFMATTGGTVKKCAMSEFESINRKGKKAMNTKEDEKLFWTAITSGEHDIILCSRQGKAVIFDESEVREMGRTAAGVRGMRLSDDDAVVQMQVLQPVEDEETRESKLLIVMEKGRGKMTKVKEYRKTARGAKGVVTAKITPKTGVVIGARVIREDMEGDLLITSKKGQSIRLPLRNIRTTGRNASGVILFKPASGDGAQSLSLLLDGQDDATEESQEALL